MFSSSNVSVGMPPGYLQAPVDPGNFPIILNGTFYRPTTEEGRRPQQSKHCNNNTEDDSIIIAGRSFLRKPSARCSHLQTPAQFHKSNYAERFFYNNVHHVQGPRTTPDRGLEFMMMCGEHNS